MVARRLGLAVLVVVCALSGLCGLGVGSALAFVTRPYEESFGSDGVSGSKFTEERPGALAVDQATGSIYVGDGYFDQSVSKFNVAHEPEPFTGLAPYIVGGRLTGFGVMWQIAVDSASHVLYVADGSPVKAFQPDGEPANFTAGPAAGANELPGSEVCGVTVDSSGDIYVSEFAGGIQVYASSGEPLTIIPVSEVCNLAVGANGVVYANQHPEPSQGQSGPVERIVPSGPPPVSSSTTYEQPVVVDENASFTLAVDPATGHVLVDEGQQVAEYDQGGTRLGTFGSTVPGALPRTQGAGLGLAVNDVSGRVYVGQGNFEGQVEVFGPAILVPDLTTEPVSDIDPKGGATLNGRVKPDEVALTECEFEYVDAEHYEPAASNPYAAGATAQCAPAAGDVPLSGETQVSAQITGLTPGGTYHFRLKAANANGANDGADATVELPPLPSIEAASTTNVTRESADLNVQIDPGSLETTYHFEYDTSPYSPSEPEGAHGTSVGAGEIAANAGNTSIGPVEITKLDHDHIYYWRVVATNEAGTTLGADHTFVYDTSGEGLPDDRAYEMVTPPHKDAALTGGVTTMAEDGSRIVSDFVQCFADAASCDVVHGIIGVPYMFSRESTGWVTSAPAPSAAKFDPSVLVAVNPTSGVMLWGIPTPPLSGEDFYTRELDGAFVDVGPFGESHKIERGALAPVFTTPDFSRVVYQSGTLWPSLDQESDGSAVYEFVGSENQKPALVGVSGEGFGNADLISGCGTILGNSDIGNSSVLSADGETIYFVAKECPGGTGANVGREVPVDELFARVDGAQPNARTVPVSEPSAFSAAAPYSGCAQEPCIKNVNEKANWAGAGFTHASSDGTRVLFTSTQQLTDSATQGELNWYLYDSRDLVQEPGLAPGHIIDVSAGDTSGHGARVQGLVAFSSDGSHIYFVAKGVLTSQPNGLGQTARDGAYNLYAFERDPANPMGRVSFVTQFLSRDFVQWTEGGELANVTPDGRFLVFESSGHLTLDDTRADEATQIFRYDAQTGQLVRISVGQRGFNDNGNAGSGGAEIVRQNHSGAFFAAGPKRPDPTMSHDGSYVFFESPIGLTTHALNDVPLIGSTGIPVYNLGGEQIFLENIYEWHEGRVSLISDGTDTATITKLNSATHLLGSDASGSNVLFETADPLVPQDTDTQIDIYDARVCATASPCVAQPPPPLPPCAGETCHGTPAATPSKITAPTASFNGQGDISVNPGPAGQTKKAKKKRAVKCSHGRRRVHHRCVKVRPKGRRARGSRTGKEGK